MQHNKILKYILDIESIIQEIEQIKNLYNTYDKFDNDFLVKRAIERELEIIGEAINNIRKINPKIEISGVKQIVNLRNLIIHSYDSVDSAILWGIIQKDIPLLKQELIELKK